MNYYNEFDPKAAAWLRELITSGLIPDGIVDERSITEIKPHELSPYTQCHFFAGIGGWSLALQLAGWPADRPVWTGSCPCQSFSSAGQGKGTSDHRDLWPVFAALIRECRPATVFGEQVEAAIGYGWLDRVCADMEAEDYAVGAHVLGAHSAGAPHIRQRLYWVADSEHRERGIAGKLGQAQGNRVSEISREGTRERELVGDLATCSLADATGGQREQRIRPQVDELQRSADDGANLRLGDPQSGGFGIVRDAARPGSGGHALGASWAGFEIVHCRDGKARRFEPGSFPLAAGLPGRVGLLRGYGNAICPQTAQIFIEAFLGQ